MEENKRHNNCNHLIRSISDINRRLDDVQEYMDKDFLGISKRLRVYNKQLNTVTDDAETIYNVVENENIVQFFNILKNTSKTLDWLKFGYFRSLEKSFVSLNIQLKQLNISIQALNRLNSLLDKSSIDNGNSLVDEGAGIIVSLTKAYKLKRLVLVQSDWLVKLRNVSEEFWSAISDQLKAVTGFITEQHQFAKEAAPGLKKKTSDCLSNIDQIIVDLQYHDIIRQKIEHVQETNSKLIDELSEFSSSGSCIDKPGGLNYISKLSGILKLHAEILNLANNECQSSTSGIKTNLEKILEGSKAISVFRLEYSDYLSFADNDFTEELANELYRSVEKIEDMVILVSKIKHGVLSHSEICSRIEKYSSSLLQYVEQEQVKEKGTLDERAVLNIEETVSKVLYFGSIGEEIISTEFSRKRTDLIQSLKNDFAGISSQVLSLLDPVGLDDSHEVKEKDQLSITVTAELKHLLEHIDESNYFEKSVDELQDKMKTVLGKFEIEDSEEADKIYEEIRESYTMSSERKLHDEVLGADGQDDIDEDDSIEFF